MIETDASPEVRHCKHCGLEVRLVEQVDGAPAWAHFGRDLVTGQPQEGTWRRCLLTFYAEPETVEGRILLSQVPEWLEIYPGSPPPTAEEFAGCRAMYDQAKSWRATEPIRVHFEAGRSPSVTSGGRPPRQREGETDEQFYGRLGKDVPGLGKPLTGIASLPPTKQREGDQRLPDSTVDGPDDFVLYGRDIEARRQVGIERYGQAHMPFNGRNTLLDAYEEVLDTGLYLRSLLRMAEADRETLIQVVRSAIHPHLTEDSGKIAEIAVDRIMGWVVGRQQS